eukprot:13481-Pelagococcus_subviridis.AAC.1
MTPLGSNLPPATMFATCAYAASTQYGFPLTTTLHGSVVWSICTRAPLDACSPLMVSPPLPMTLGRSIRSDVGVELKGVSWR